MPCLFLLNPSDVDDIDDGSREVSKFLPSEQGLAEAQQTIQDETEPNASLKEVDDDNISVTIQAEDAITLDFDGDDLLETGKTMKIPKCENKTVAEKDSQSQDDMKGEVKIEGKKEKIHKEGRKEEGSKAESAKKETREGSRKAEAGEKEKDSSKKGPSSGASGQAKRFVFLCQFMILSTNSQISMHLRVIMVLNLRPNSILQLILKDITCFFSKDDARLTFFWYLIFILYS